MVSKDKIKTYIERFNNWLKYSFMGRFTFISVFMFMVIMIIFSFNSFYFMGKYFSHIESDNPRVTDVTDECNLESSDIKKIKCVNTYVQNNFKYSVSGMKISIKDLFSDGGDCKSWSMYYHIVLERMDIDTKFVYLDNHIYLVAYSDDYYCSLDQTKLDCVSLS